MTPQRFLEGLDQRKIFATGHDYLSVTITISIGRISEKNSRIYQITG